MRYAVVACVLLSSCATASEFRGADGSRQFLVECPGAAVRMSLCMTKAREMCGGSFQLVQANEAPGAIFANRYGMGQGMQRSIIVRCN